MESVTTGIPLQGLAIAFIPMGIAIAIIFRWSAGGNTAVYAALRMLVQLLLIGYVLVYIFDTENPIVIAGVLVFMLVASSWIAIRPLPNKSIRTYSEVLFAISAAGLFTLALVSQAVLNVEPWFSPRYLVPLAGMIFAGAMNTVSIAAERLVAEQALGRGYVEARRSAFGAALIPITNSLFAVGLVSLPGMMTGQILSGVSPLVAAKYQIVVMTMMFGASGIAAAIYLSLRRHTFNNS